MSVTFTEKTLSGIGKPWWTLSHATTWQHPTPDDTAGSAIVVTVLVRRNEPIDPVVDVRFGDLALVSQGRVWLNNLPHGQRTHSFLELFCVVVEDDEEEPPEDAPEELDVTVTVSSGTRFTGEFRAACFTYEGVGRAGKFTSAYGTGSALSVTSTSLTGRRVVAAFAHESYPAIDDFSGTSRYALDLGFAISEGVVGDVAGATSVTVTGTGSGKPWCGAALDLVAAAEGDDLLQGGTPIVDVAPPPPSSPVTVPVLTLDPGFFPMQKNWLRAEFFRFPYVPVRVPYSNWPLWPFAQLNAAGGVSALDRYLHRYVGTRILVLGHSMGSQIVYKWLRERGSTSDIDPTEVTFVCTGNPERKYNGYPDGGDYPGGEGGTGLPDGAHGYRVIDIARQYDFWADHPDDTDNEIAMRNVAPLGGDLGAGNPMHLDYSMVSANPADERNFSVTEATVTYVWAPTYPAPIIDDADFFKTAQGIAPRDEVVRELIEAGYSRPVEIPPPPEGGSVLGQFPWGWIDGLWQRVAPSSAQAPSPLTWWLEEED